MKVYFACSIIGGRQDEAAYRLIVEAMLDAGHQVPTAANAGVPGHGGLEPDMDATAVYQRDIAWIDACAALVAEVSTPSHGVGYEIAYALGQGKPVLCLWRKGVNVSKMLTGNKTLHLELAEYTETAEAIRSVLRFLAR